MSMLLLLAAQAATPPPPADPNEEEIVVRGYRPEITVRGARPPRCRARDGDPLDAVSIPSTLRQSMLVPGRSPRLQRDSDPVMGDTWQRAGRSLPAYVFRAREDDSPLCIGARRDNEGFGQLRRILDARLYHGKYVRFTAYVATRDAGEVRFWLAAGNRIYIQSGGDTSTLPLRGTHAWMPVSLTIGPVSRLSTKLSYGFLVMGSGDAWLSEPRLEAIEQADVQASPQAPALGHVGD